MCSEPDQDGSCPGIARPQPTRHQKASQPEGCERLVVPVAPADNANCACRRDAHSCQWQDT